MNGAYSWNKLLTVVIKTHQHSYQSKGSGDQILPHIYCTMYSASIAEAYGPISDYIIMTSLLSSVITHTVYLIGQIVLTRQVEQNVSLWKSPLSHS